MDFKLFEKLWYVYGIWKVGRCESCCAYGTIFSCMEPMDTPFHLWQWCANGKWPYADEGIEHAAQILSRFAIKLLREPNILSQAQEEHRNG